MSIRLTILCENSVDSVSPYGLLGEHGFACHIATPEGNYLFDSGGGMTILNNAEKLGIDFSKLQGILLSHGHYDHVGGLKQVLDKCRVPLPVYAHPDIFTAHQSKNSGRLVDIGLPWPQTELEAMGAQFKLSSQPLEVTGNLTLSGEIPQRHPEETGDPNLVIPLPDGSDQRDPLHDDLSLFIRTNKGLVILLGCAHSGLMNIIDQALAVTGEQKVHMVLGGTHLKFCSEEQMLATLDKLEQLGVEKIGASHCTGLRGARRLAERFGERYFSASVGVKIEL